VKIFILTFLITFSLLQNGTGQVKSREIVNKDFNWRIEIPEGFESVSAEEWTKMQNRGADAIEKTHDVKVENNAKTIFVFKSDQFHYFESNYQPFDSKTDGNYLENVKDVNQLLYSTFEAQMPGARLDSVSSQETIDGKVFQVFKILVSIPDKITIELLMYNRLFGNREFTVNIMTVNKEKQRVLLNAWRNSKFGTE
jgi:hypothetical protein